MLLKEIFLLTCAFFTLQSYSSEGSRQNQKQQPSASFGKVAFGPEGEITGIATGEQAKATGALIQKLWDMSCKDVSCKDCPRCVGKRLALATKLKSQDQIDTSNQRLRSFLSQATSAISSHASSPKPGDKQKTTAAESK